MRVEDFLPISDSVEDGKDRSCWDDTHPSRWLARTQNEDQGNRPKEEDEGPFCVGRKVKGEGRGRAHSIIYRSTDTANEREDEKEE